MEKWFWLMSNVSVQPSVTNLHTHSSPPAKGNKFSLPRPPSQTYLRATGPKTVHASQTLHFLSPSQYKERRKKADRHNLTDNSALSQSYRQGGLRVHTMESGDKMATIGRHPHGTSTVQYHSPLVVGGASCHGNTRLLMFQSCL